MQPAAPTNPGENKDPQQQAPQQPSQVPQQPAPPAYQSPQGAPQGAWQQPVTQVYTPGAFAPQPQMMQPYPAAQPGMPYQQQPVYYTAQNQAVQVQPGQQMMMMPPGTAITAQPGGQKTVMWMVRPQAIPGCPPGLEYLTQVDQLVIQQQIELLEVMTGIQTANKYRVFNSMGQQCYYAYEESSTCGKLFAGTLREFNMHVVDNMNQEILRIFRPFKCTCGGFCACCDACTPEVQIEAPPGTPIGYVRSNFFCFTAPSFTILDAGRNPIFAVKGHHDCCPCNPTCPGDYNFNIFQFSSNDRSPNSRIGRLTKQWSGYFQEMYTNADNFNVSFPQNLDVQSKALMLGMLFLVDFMFYENKQQGHHHHH